MKTFKNIAFILLAASATLLTTTIAQAQVVETELSLPAGATGPVEVEIVTESGQTLTITLNPGRTVSLTSLGISGKVTINVPSNSPTDVIISNSTGAKVTMEPGASVETTVSSPEGAPLDISVINGSAEVDVSGGGYVRVTDPVTGEVTMIQETNIPKRIEVKIPTNPANVI